eukprot:scaffold83396_cov28-Tisochrysis_lutea.AAC.5
MRVSSARSAPLSWPDGWKRADSGTWPCITLQNEASRHACTSANQLGSALESAGGPCASEPQEEASPELKRAMTGSCTTSADAKAARTHLEEAAGLPSANNTAHTDSNSWEHRSRAVAAGCTVWCSNQTAKPSGPASPD